ncbi:TIGR01621 family pseudouridine synthase [Shewanella sp. 202IG2-18]|uniref:TIGR01621 family pseudouridine synthase n=1 Tax=Parashewanella hymeniacidonis TaxID=2807618 RepID=UPI001961EC89|nr:TIGR01621 family pseudouridine synthase [Parashewanella hymeniacidonis]MBM7071744.1 TIGR01621 family pseudouridine synthase [Parashewanella hymeniacidonis]
MQNSNYQILADEPHFIVINKSPNVHFHSQNGSAGVVAQVEADYDLSLFPVHRLDTPTSGLLLLAKSSAAANQLAEQFKQRLTEKYYLAIAKGKPKKKQGWVIGDMTKSRRSMHKLLHTKANPAITQFYSHTIAERLRLYLLKPDTGRTHQLRVALSSLGVPILGDDLYGKQQSDRCYLHAYALKFQFNKLTYQYVCLPSLGEEFQRESLKVQLGV